MSTRLEAYEGAPELEGRLVAEPGWYLLRIAPNAFAPLLQLLPPFDLVIDPAPRPHISVIKGESPSRNQGDWGVAFIGEPVTVRYAPVPRGENGLHVWVDCYSPRLCELREHFGLATLRRGDGVYLVNFHLTLGRRRQPVEPQQRPQLRLSPQSHIDVETGMQHL